MEYKKFDNLVVLRLERGEEILESIKKVVDEEKITLGTVSGIGATDNVRVGILDLEEKVYKDNTFKKPLEITSLLGNITEMNGESYLHLHINVGDEKGNVYGGHLNHAYISATAEIFIQTYNARVDRFHDEEIGINLMDLK